MGGLPSKEEKVLELFFNKGSKHWHFEEIVKTCDVTRNKVNKWLQRFISEGLIKKIKEKGKMPYYTSDFYNPAYRNKKRIYALTNFYETGFLNHLINLKEAKTIIIFGSFSRGDWYDQSDIDIFIYGGGDDFEQGKFEVKLKREIQTFICNSKEELNKFRKDLLKNIFTGYFVKGNLDFMGDINA